MIFLIGLYLTFIILSKKSLIFMIFVIFLSIYFIYQKKYYPLFFLIILLIPFSKNEYFFKEINSSFLVIESKKNYAIITNFKEKFIVYEELNFLDIITINGEIKDINGFLLNNRVSSFKDYLNNRNIFYEIKINELDYIFKSPFKSFIKHSEEASIYLDYVLFNNKKIDEEFFELLKNNFLLPLFVVSGMHINLLYDFLKNKFKIYSFLILLIYLLFLQFQLPSLRAFLFLIFKEINDKKNLNISNFNLFILVYIFMLILNPFSLFNFSFILTFLCSFLLFFIEGNNFKKTVLLNLGLLPIIITMNKKINLIGIFVSFIYSFLFKYFYLFSFIFYFIPFFDSFYILIFDIITLNLNIFNNLKIDFIIGNFSLIILIIYYFIYYIILFKNKFNLKIKKEILIIILLINCLSFRINFFDYSRIVFLDIGQGNLTLIIDKNEVSLIDTGGSKYTNLAKQRIIPYLHSFGIKKIDNVIISHDDFDHMGALKDILLYMDVSNIYKSWEYEEINLKNLRIKNLNYNPKFIGDDNEESGVFYFNFLNQNYLIMSDVSTKVEEKIIEKYELNVDYLLVGHHASKHSSSYEFLKNINPSLAIISCGKNNYGHPSDIVLNNLNKLNIPYKRTDKDGSIVVQNNNIFMKIID